MWSGERTTIDGRRRTVRNQFERSKGGDRTDKAGDENGIYGENISMLGDLGRQKLVVELNVVL